MSQLRLTHFLAFFLIFTDLALGEDVASSSALRVTRGVTEQVPKGTPKSLSPPTLENPSKARKPQVTQKPPTGTGLNSANHLTISESPKAKPELPVSPLRTVGGPPNKSSVLPNSSRIPAGSNPRLDSCSSSSLKKNSSCKRVTSLVAGMFFPDVPAYGALGSVPLNPDLSLGTQLVYNSVDLEKNQKIKDLYYHNISLRFIQVGGFLVKTFAFSESFYLKPALSYRVLETGMNGYKNTVNGDFDFSLATKSQYLVASTSLGNRFTFQNRVTVGCDWIGIAVPLSLKKENSGQYNGTSDPELQATSNRLFKAFQKPHLQLFFVSVGWQF